MLAFCSALPTPVPGLLDRGWKRPIASWEPWLGWDLLWLDGPVPRRRYGRDLSHGLCFKHDYVGAGTRPGNLQQSERADSCVGWSAPLAPASQHGSGPSCEAGRAGSAATVLWVAACCLRASISARLRWG